MRKALYTETPFDRHERVQYATDNIQGGHTVFHITQTARPAEEEGICIRKVTGSCSNTAVWTLSNGVIALSACAETACITAAYSAVELAASVYYTEMGDSPTT